MQDVRRRKHSPPFSQGRTRMLQEPLPDRLHVPTEVVEGTARGPGIRISKGIGRSQNNAARLTPASRKLSGRFFSALAGPAPQQTSFCSSQILAKHLTLNLSAQEV